MKPFASNMRIHRIAVLSACAISVILLFCAVSPASIAFADTGTKGSIQSLSTTAKSKPVSERTINNGVYVIESLTASSQAIDVTGASEKKRSQCPNLSNKWNHSPALAC